MAVGTQFSVLLDQLRSETGQSVNAAHGTNVLATLKHELNSAYETIYDMFAWPHLKGRFDVKMKAGERFYDLPVVANTITKVEFKYNSIWTLLVEGIGGEHYNAFDSEASTPARSDPLQRWQRYGQTQFEVWPIPATGGATGGATVRFWGRQAWSKLVNNSDVAIVDDRLIVLRAAIKRLTGEKREAKVEEFTDAFRNLKKRAVGAQDSAVLGADDQPLTRRPQGNVRYAVSVNK